jgi:hypothetical protein
MLLAGIDPVGRLAGLGQIHRSPVPAGTGRHRALDVFVALPRELEGGGTSRDRQLSGVMSLVATETQHDKIAHRVIAAVLALYKMVQI